MSELMEKGINYRKISCDQVCWIKNALERVNINYGYPGIARSKDIQIFRGLLEIMEILGLSFEDSLASHNAISSFPELYTTVPKTSTDEICEIKANKE